MDISAAEAEERVSFAIVGVPKVFENARQDCASKRVQRSFVDASALAIAACGERREDVRARSGSSSADRASVAAVSA